MLLALCAGVDGHASTQPQGTLVHGPYEIVVGARRVPTGTFPNQGGSPLATREAAEFQVRWRGKPVALPGGELRFWRVLRLEGAPRPALLLVTQDFALATEDASGRLQVTPLQSMSASLAEAQWLDARSGQPGPSMRFGIEQLPDLEASTRLAGGLWLRLGARFVIDVGSLAVHPVSPWLPMPPGKPVTGLERQDDGALAFSPGRSHYVLLAAGVDHTSPGQPEVNGLLVVDIARGVATELRMDRRRFRFAAGSDVTLAWLNHHFEWTRDAAGRDRLVPRARFTPWPWRAHSHVSHPGDVELQVRRIDSAFLGVLRRLALAMPGVRNAGLDTRSAATEAMFTVDGCVLHARADGEGSPFADDQRIVLRPQGAPPASPACEAALRRMAAAIDAELASGRHDALLKLD